jgi:Sulfotransferase domain
MVVPMRTKDRATAAVDNADAGAAAVAVIGVGLPRTGTASLQAALNELGLGPCYHMFELIRRPRWAPLWLAAAEGRPVDWSVVLAGYRSTVDFPGAYFWRELVAAYPEAKVVLTLRDPDRWFASVLHMARGGRSMRVMTSRPVLFLVPVLRPLTRLMERMTMRMLDVDRDAFMSGQLDRDHFVEVYQRHAAEVTSTVSPDRLLIFRVDEGWEPLCRFLGVPVPSTPFPHRNESAAFHRDMWRRNAATYARALGLTALVALVLLGIGLWALG